MSRVEALYPLSPLQHGILFHSVAAPRRDPYVRQNRYLLEGDLAAAALVEAWRAVAAAHPVLRTGLFWQGLDAPLQAVRRDATIELAVEDVAGVEPARRVARLDAIAARDRSLGFDLARPPLARATLVRTGPREHVLVFTFHHVVLDGWSEPIVVGDAFLAYVQLLAGGEPELPRRRPFSDYVDWLGSRPADELRAYWRARLEGVAAPTPLPGRIESSGNERRHETAFELERTPLDAFCRRERITAATLLHGAWAVATGVDEAVFGTVVSGRPDELDGVAEMTGLFLNTLPVRVALPSGGPSGPWLRELQAALAADRQHGYLPLGEVAAHPIDSFVVFMNAPDLVPPELARFGDLLRVTPQPGPETSGVPFRLVGTPGERLRVGLDIDVDQVEPDAGAELLERVGTALLALAAGRVPPRKAAAATSGAAPAAAEHVEPRNDLERALAGVYVRTLGLDRVGIHDDFFALGGDSLLALRLVARAREAGLAFDLREILARPTVAQLAGVCRAVDGGFGFERTADGDDDVPLAPIQRHYLESAGRDPALHDQVGGLEFGLRLDPPAVETALRALAARHPALRTAFVYDGSRWRQRVLPAGEATQPRLTVVDLTELEPDDAERTSVEVASELRATHDLATGTPCSVLLVLLPGERSRLVVAVHHLVFEPYCWSVLLPELGRAVLLGPGELEEQAPPPYAVWTRHLESLPTGDARLFWERELADVEPGFPVDFVRDANDIASTAVVAVRVAADPTAQVLRDGRVDGQLAGALARSYARWAGRYGLYLFTAAGCRDVAPPGVDLSRTIGWFTARAPVWLPAGCDAGAALARTRPYRHLWDRVSEGLPVPAIMLSYLGQPQREQHVPPEAPVAPLRAPIGDWRPGDRRLDPTFDRGSLLHVEAAVVGGRLAVNFLYSTNRHRRESIEAFAEAFHEELVAGVPQLEATA